MTDQALKPDFNHELMAYLGDSPTPFHAVKNIQVALEDSGFKYLSESDQWDLQPGGRYYTTRNGSSIIALVVGRHSMLDNGIRMIGAHTDSPCLMVKPNPELVTNNYFKLGVEVYGGALLNPWFDRDLSLAGRVVYRDQQGTLKQTLVDFKSPVAVIPSLAIHLDRKANDSRSINAQTDIPPVLFRVEDGRFGNFRDMLAGTILSGRNDVAEVLDYELSFYDSQSPSLVGLYQDFIASARIDNLLSCFVGLKALLAADGEQTCLLVCNDHEEVGSRSACGADGPMLKALLCRLVTDEQQLSRILDKSLMVSTDNAHGVHPNYPEKHDSNHGPLLNGGPVIKVNARQRYATTGTTAALFRQLAADLDIPLQSFVARTDMGCGSTIGPITAAAVGVQTLDVGVPTFAMHSIRELAGVDDAFHLYLILSRLNNESGPLQVAEATN